MPLSRHFGDTYTQLKPWRGGERWVALRQSHWLAIWPWEFSHCFAAHRDRSLPQALRSNLMQEIFRQRPPKLVEYCRTLWSDHAFDPLRDKIPLLGEQPTSSMLTNPQRVRPEDKPLADLALKTAEKCKAAAATAWAMLPPPVHAKMLSTYTAGGCVKYPTL